MVRSVHGGGHAWQGTCMVGGMHGRGVCMAGGMHGGVGVCVADTTRYGQ